MTTKKFTMSKLVRDKTPENLTSEGVKIKWIPCKNQSELLYYYKKKIVEEAIEVKETQTRQELLEEVSDCLEVIDGLLALMKIEKSEIEEVKKNKYKKRGAFKKGFIIDSIEIPENSPWIDYFQKDPLKYPESS